MDLRDDVHTQLEEHIKTLRVIAKQAPPPQLVWDEIKRILDESAMYLETFTLPKVAPVTPYLDLRTGTLGNSHKVAPLVVGETSEEAREEDERDVAPGFLRSNGAVKA